MPVRSLRGSSVYSRTGVDQHCMGQFNCIRFRSALLDTAAISTLFPGASPGQKVWGGHAWRARGVQAYNGIWGRSPSGVQSRAPGHGSEGKAALKLKTFYLLMPNGSSKFASFFKLQTNPRLGPSSQIITYWICINLRNDFWQKWGGHVHPSPPRGDAPVCFTIVR